jgi:hypothetical protein
MILNSPTISGSLTVTGNTILSGSITSLAGIAGTASYATNAEMLDGLDSTSFTTTSSFDAASSSFSTRVANTEATASAYVASSGSFSTRTTNAENYIASINARTGSYATTGSNYFIGTQVITGSVYIANDLIVQGSSSLQNITASAVSVGTNTIILNTATPILQFGGISVFDSGSTMGRSGSLLWNSINDHWINVNPSGSDEGYNSAMVINGPKNTGSLGSEAGLTTNYIPVSQGEDHITDSIIFQSGSVNIGIGTVTPSAKLDVAGTLRASGVATFLSSVTVVGNGRNVTINGGVDIKGDAGGWITQHGFLGSDGADLGGFGANGSGNTISSYYIGTQGTPRVTVLTGGNVGINTTSPSKLLTVRHGSSDGIRVEFSGNTDNILIDASSIQAFASTTTSLLKLNTSGGNVTIGTGTDSGFKFDVNGTGRFTSTLTVQQGLSISGNGGAITNSANKINIDFASGNSRYYSLGTNSSTKGGFEFHTNSSDGSLDVIALGIASTGAATFSNSVTAGGNFTTTADGGASGLRLTLNNTGAGEVQYALLSGGSAGTGIFGIRNGSVGTNIFLMNGSGAATFASSITLGGNIMLPGSISSSSQLNFKNVGTEFQLMNFPASNNTVTLYGATDRIYFKTDKSVSNQNILSIGTDSNIGIGTTTPLYKLDVNGISSISTANFSTSAENSSIYFNNTYPSNYALAKIGYGTDGQFYTGYLSFSTTAVANANVLIERMRITSGGKVGIGTTSPDSLLDVADSSSNTIMLVRNTSTANTTGKNAMYGFWGTDTVGTPKAVGGMQAVPNDVNWVNGLLYWYVRAGDGQVLRMSLSSGGALVISGALTQNGSPSDINLKENLVKISSPLEKISQINGYNFEWKEGSPARSNISNIVEDAGVIAQEIEEVMPEIVRMSDDNKVVNYNGLIALLIEGIKELSSKNTTLEARLTALESAQ